MKIFAPLVLASAVGATYTLRTQNWASTDCTGVATGDSTLTSGVCIGGFQYKGTCSALYYQLFSGMAATTCTGSPTLTYPTVNQALTSGKCVPNPVTGGAGIITCTCTDAACRSAGSRASLLAPTAWLVVATAAAAHLGTSIH